MDPWAFGWSAIAAIGQIAAAFATVVAVVVALWAATLSHRSRIKVIAFYQNTYIIIRMINIGTRPLTIINCNLFYDKHFRISLFNRINDDSEFVIESGKCKDLDLSICEMHRLSDSENENSKIFLEVITADGKKKHIYFDQIKDIRELYNAINSGSEENM